MTLAIEVHNQRTAIHELWIIKDTKYGEVVKLFDALQKDDDPERYGTFEIWNRINELTEYIGEIHFCYLDSLRTRKNRPVNPQYYDDGENRYRLVARYSFSF